MQTIWHDLRYGARLLAQRPGFALITLLTLASFFTSVGFGQSVTPDQWVGSFERNGVLVPFEVGLTADAKTARVRITYASLAIPGFETANVAWLEDRVELTVTDRSGGRHLFRGRQADGVITGDYVASGTSAATSFSLLRLAVTTSINDWVGIYRLKTARLPMFPPRIAASCSPTSAMGECAHFSRRARAASYTATRCAFLIRRQARWISG